MKAVLEADALKHAVRTCATLVGAEVPLLITAIEKGFVRIESGLNSSYVCHTLPSKVTASGKVVIPVQRLMGLPLSGEITLSSKKDKELSFQSGAFKGSLRAESEVDAVVANRPRDRFKATTSLPTEVFQSALSRVNLGAALPGSQMGVRIQVRENEFLVSSTDQYRAALFQEELKLKHKPFDVLLQPDLVYVAISNVTSVEMSIGVHRGVFHLSSDTMDVYHPSIQQEPEDIEDWLDNGIDYKKREGRITLSCEHFSRHIKEVSSLQIGSLSYDTHFDMLVKGQSAHLRCHADHGSTKSSFDLGRSDITKYLTKMSSRYTMEMIHLIRAGDADLSFWPDFVLFEGHDGKFRGLIPTVAS